MTSLRSQTEALHPICLEIKDKYGLDVIIMRSDQFGLEAAKDLPTFDYSTLTSVNMCPRWGIVRNVLQLRMHNSGRSMPLEAGRASHDVYAASRLWSLRERGLIKHFEHHCLRLFDEERTDAMWDQVNYCAPSDAQHRQFAIAALETSGYYDDPMDKRRTVTNIEEACLAYLRRIDYATYPVWIEDETDPVTRVGIELPIDIVINVEGLWIRYIGRMDGLHLDTKHSNRMLPLENKTGSRLDDSWASSFILSHQITGYAVGIAIMLDIAMPAEAAVPGMAIPIPKNYDLAGIRIEYTKRHIGHVKAWLDWIVHTVPIILEWIDEPWNAPTETRSCTRYFRSCSMIPFCEEPDPEERRQWLEEEMTHEPWSPLDDLKEN